MENEPHYGDPAQIDALKNKRLKRERTIIAKRLARILTDNIEGNTATELMHYFPKHMKSSVQARLSEIDDVLC